MSCNFQFPVHFEILHWSHSHSEILHSHSEILHWSRSHSERYHSISLRYSNWQEEVKTDPSAGGGNVQGSTVCLCYQMTLMTTTWEHLVERKGGKEGSLTDLQPHGRGASDRLVSCLVASQVFCSCYLDLKYR